MKEFEFDFEKLTVYQKTLEFIDQIFGFYQKLSQDYKISIGSNLIRASLSVANNLAEGNGKRSLREKNRYFGTALDSMRECVSVLNVLNRQKMVEHEKHNELRSLAKEITSMIWAMIKPI